MAKFCQADSDRLFTYEKLNCHWQYHHQRLNLTLFPESAWGNVQVCYRKDERRVSFKSCISPAFTQPFIEWHFAFISGDKSISQTLLLSHRYFNCSNCVRIDSFWIRYCKWKSNFRCVGSFNKFMKLISRGKAPHTWHENIISWQLLKVTHCKNLQWWSMNVTCIVCSGSNSNALYLCRATNAGLGYTPSHVTCLTMTVNSYTAT